MKHVVVCFHLTVFVAFLCVSGTATAGIVKQSTSGLCHPQESGWYDRTQNYTPFNTGGRPLLRFGYKAVTAWPQRPDVAHRNSEAYRSPNAPEYLRECNKGHDINPDRGGGGVDDNQVEV